MLEYDFEASVGYWVALTAHALQRALSEELAELGITARQWQVLAWLALEGSLTQSQLAERMQIEQATLVSVLGRMERRGWIERASCSTDRRKKMIRPTPRVKSLWEKSVVCARRVRERATQGFSQQQLDDLKRSLALMRGNLNVPVVAREAG